jgi:dihydrofolate reductase
MEMIVAVDQGGGFGKDGEIPWKNEPFAKADMKWFQEKTKNKHLIFGRRTYEEILAMKKTTSEVLLPNRTSYVLSRDPNFSPRGATRITDHTQVSEDSLTRSDIIICGGEQLYTQFIPLVRVVYVTIIKDYYNCDRFFPITYLDTHFNIMNGEQKNDMYFMTYVRKQLFA